MIGQKAALSIANMVVGSALGLVALFLIGRFFGPDANGEMTFAFGLIGVLFFVADLGMGQAHVKRVSEGRHAGDCFATYAVFKLAMTGVFLLLAASLVFTWTAVLGRTIEDTTVGALVFALVYYTAKAFQDLGQSTFEAKVQTAKAQVAALVDTIVRVGLIALFAGILAATVSGIGPFAGVLTADLALVRWVRDNPGTALSVASAAGGVLAAFTAMSLLRGILEKGRFRKEILRDYWSFAFPLFLASTAAVVATHIDATALGLFLSKTETGIWGAIRRIPAVLQGVGAAVAVLLFPTISAMAARGERDGIQRAMDQALRYLSMLLLPTVAFVVLFAEDVIRISIGAPFVAGADALRVLCIYVVVVTFGYAHSTLLLGLGQPRIASQMGILNAVLVVILDLVLIPYDIQTLGIRLAGMGILGAAVGTLAAAAVWYAGLRIMSRRLIGYRERGHFSKHFAATVAMALALVVLDAYLLPLERWFHIPPYVLLGGAVYVAVLFLVREFGPDDVRFLRDSIHPVRMLRYVRDELFERRK